MSYDYLFKFIIIGDQGVGKSTLLQRFTDNTYNDFHEPTVGREFVIRTIEINGHRVRLQIWDTAGQEEFVSLARSYYRAAAGVLLVYDITKKKTFNDVKKWLDEARYNGHAKMSYMLIGNKCDLTNDRRVSEAEARDLASNERFNFIETSARTSVNVEKAFNELALRIYEKIKSGEIIPNDEGTDGVKPGKGFNMKGVSKGGGFENHENQSNSYQLSKEKTTGPVTCKDNCGC